MAPSFVPVMVDGGEAPPDNRPPYWSWPDSRFGWCLRGDRGRRHAVGAPYRRDICQQLTHS